MPVPFVLDGAASEHEVSGREIVRSFQADRRGIGRVGVGEIDVGVATVVPVLDLTGIAIDRGADTVQQIGAPVVQTVPELLPRTVRRRVRR